MGYGIGGRLVSKVGGIWDWWEVVLKNKWDMGLVGSGSLKQMALMLKLLPL